MLCPIYNVISKVFQGGRCDYAWAKQGSVSFMKKSEHGLLGAEQKCMENYKSEAGRSAAALQLKTREASHLVTRTRITMPST